MSSLFTLSLCCVYGLRVCVSSISACCCRVNVSVCLCFYECLWLVMRFICVLLRFIVSSCCVSWVHGVSSWWLYVVCLIFCPRGCKFMEVFVRYLDLVMCALIRSLCCFSDFLLLCDWLPCFVLWCHIACLWMPICVDRMSLFVFLSVSMWLHMFIFCMSSLCLLFVIFVFVLILFVFYDRVMNNYDFLWCSYAFFFDFLNDVVHANVWLSFVIVGFL